jgi:hypothetical protein
MSGLLVFPPGMPYRVLTPFRHHSPCEMVDR